MILSLSLLSFAFYFLPVLETFSLFSPTFPLSFSITSFLSLPLSLFVSLSPTLPPSLFRYILYPLFSTYAYRFCVLYFLHEIYKYLFKIIYCRYLYIQLKNTHCIEIGILFHAMASSQLFQLCNMLQWILLRFMLAPSNLFL